MKKTIVGLDLSSVNTGWAVLDAKDGSLIDYGNLKPPKTYGQLEKIHFMYSQIKTLLTKFDICDIVIEDQFGGKNIKTLILLARISGAIIALCSESSYNITLYSPTHIKKFITGNGKSGKEDLAKVITAIYKLDRPYDDNTTDAICIAYSKYKGLK